MALENPPSLMGIHIRRQNSKDGNFRHGNGTYTYKAGTRAPILVNTKMAKWMERMVEFTYHRRWELTKETVSIWFSKNLAMGKAIFKDGGSIYR